MKIQSVTNFLPDFKQTIGVEKQKDDKFDNVLSNFVGNVNQSQLNADNMVQDFVDGKDVQIQDVMIAGEKAKTNLDLLVEIRNKTLDMYKELTRMIP